MEKKNRPFVFFLMLSGAIHLTGGVVLIFSDLQKFFFAERTVVSAVKVNLSAMPLPSDPDKLPLKRAKKPSLKTAQKKIKKKPSQKKPAQKKPKKEKPVSSKPPPETPPLKTPPSEALEESSPPDRQEQEQKSVEETEKAGDNSEAPPEGAEAARLKAENIERLRSYVTNIVTRIRLNWNLPKSLAEKDLFAQVEIQVSESGEVLSQRLVASSQNELFDKLALQAVERAAPFPPPPPEIRKLITGGIVFGLRGRD